MGALKVEGEGYYVVSKVKYKINYQSDWLSECHCGSINSLSTSLSMIKVGLCDQTKGLKEYLM